MHEKSGVVGICMRCLTDSTDLLNLDFFRVF